MKTNRRLNTSKADAEKSNEIFYAKVVLNSKVIHYRNKNEI